MSQRHRASFLIRLAVVLAVCVMPATRAAVVYVDVNNTSGTEDGTDRFPYTSIQVGINNALSGDEVSVAPGVYAETLLMKAGVDVRGSGWLSTVLDATGISNSAVTFSGTGGNPVLSGFMITGGKGDLAGDIGGTPITVGGGIKILNSSPVVEHNLITGNIVDLGYCVGGGIYIDAQAASPIIRENILSGNTALSSTVADDGRGGGIYITAKVGDVRLTGNRFVDNVAVEGGAIFVDNSAGSSALIERNDIRGNEAVAGAGVWLSDSTDSTTRVINNLFDGNGSDVASALGGGVLAQASGTGMFRIVNNTFVNQNLSQGDGGALFLDDSLATTTNSLVANNIVALNTAVNGGGIVYTAYSGTIRSNDFHANPGGDLHDGGGSTATLLDNQFVDPLFLLTQKNTYRLDPSSTLIDAAADDVAPGEDHDRFVRPFDGNGDATDQSDFGAGEFPSREIDGVRFAAATLLEWDVLSLQESYDVYRGAMATLRATGAYTQDPLSEPLAAQFCGVLPAELPYGDTFEPAAGELVYYLVTLAMGTWEGVLGDDSARFPRPNTNACAGGP